MARKKKNTIKLVHIEWLDASGKTGTWFSKEEVRDYLAGRNELCTTGGLLLGEDEQFYLVSIGVNAYGDIGSCDKIPKSMVTKFKVFYDTGKEFNLHE